MSRVYEPVWVGATGDCGCGYGMWVCNPHSTCTHDMGLTGLKWVDGPSGICWLVWLSHTWPHNTLGVVFSYHHLHRPSPISLPTAANCPHMPLPSPEGCGLACSYSIEGYGRKNTRGDPASGRPSWCVMRTGHDSWPVLAYPSFLDPN